MGCGAAPCGAAPCGAAEPSDCTKRNPPASVAVRPSPVELAATRCRRAFRSNGLLSLSRPGCTDRGATQSNRRMAGPSGAGCGGGVNRCCSNSLSWSCWGDRFCALADASDPSDSTTANITVLLNISAPSSLVLARITERLLVDNRSEGAISLCTPSSAAPQLGQPYLLARPRARCVISQPCSTNLSRCSRSAATKAVAERALASRAAVGSRAVMTRAVARSAAPVPFGQRWGQAASRPASAEPDSGGS